MTAWTDFTKKVYEAGKQKNPDYKFKNALKDAAIQWKGGAGDKPQMGGEAAEYKGGEAEKPLMGGKRKKSAKRKASKKAKKSQKRKSRKSRK